MIRRSGGDTPRSATSGSAPSFGPPSRGKKIWTVEEDENLKNLVGTYGTGNWTLVAQSLPDRTGKQCRERWHNHLGSGIKKGEWTEEEDRIIITMQRHIGNQWAKITKMLPGRTDNAVKNRFHATERAKSRGKCDESMYNTALDEAYFESLKKQHTDIDFDVLCEQHANAIQQGIADGSSVDNTRTSSITGSDASSTRGKTRANGAHMALDSYMDDGAHEDDALSEEDDEEDENGEDGNPQEEYLGAHLADVGRIDDGGEADPMHLMDIDIISFDSDDMNLDFEEGMHQQDTRNPAGDSCCFSFFDWGCSSYYKNVFNPATDKRNQVGLPSSSAQANQGRPQVFKKEGSGQSAGSNPQLQQQAQQQQQMGNFYNLPPAPTGAIEMHPIGMSGAPAPMIGQPGPTPLQLAAQAAQMSSHGTPTPQQQQQAQMLYAAMPVAPTGQPASSAQYQQFLAHQQQQQMQLQQQQQYMAAAYQQGLTPQQQAQFQQFQQQQQMQQAQLQQAQMHSHMQNQYLQQQQFQQAQMMPAGAFPQQYTMHAQYAMQQQQQQQQQMGGGGPGNGATRPLSTSSYGSGGGNNNSRPPSSSSYGGSVY